MEEKEQKTTETKGWKLQKGEPLWAIWQIVEAILFIVGGILAIVYSGSSELQQTILYVIGAFLIAGGALKILANFLPILSATDRAALTYDLVVGGSIELALGITIVSDIAGNNAVADAIVHFISLFIGIALIIFGAIAAIYCLAILFNKYLGMTGLSITGLVIGALLIALGAIVIVQMSTSSAFYKVVLIIVGVVLVLSGIGALINAINEVKRRNRINKAKEVINEVAATFEVVEEKPESEDNTEEK